MPDDVAIAGPEGKRLQSLIGHVEQGGADVLHDITYKALSRIIAHSPQAVVAAGGLYDASEFQRLANYFASLLATGDMLGRARLHELYGPHSSYRTPAATFAEPTPWSYLPDSITIMAPQEAVSFFSSLVPTLHVDPVRYGSAMQRAAFTLAHQTEQTVLSKVQDLILKALTTGENWRTTPAAIGQVLNDIGVAPTNPQYASMVFRTNMMDAYITGGTTEIQRDPQIASFFPVWQYIGIRDGREGDDHRPRFDNYYPSTRTFHDIRGPRVFNCRCGPKWVDKYQWADLQRQGAKLSYA